MAFTKEQSKAALKKLPDDIPIVLEEGQHNGKRQLFAKWHNYRLVVGDAFVQSLILRAGQSWFAHPEYTPNGHIVICSVTQEPIIKPEKISRNVVVAPGLTLSDIANRMAERPADVVRECMKMGVMSTYNTELDLEVQQILVRIFGHKIAEDSGASN